MEQRTDLFNPLNQTNERGGIYIRAVIPKLSMLGRSFKVGPGTSLHIVEKPLCAEHEMYANLSRMGKACIDNLWREKSIFGEAL